MNILGIDWGEKRIGLAFSDALNVAVPIGPAVQKKIKQRLGYIESIISERSIELIVIGYPLNMDGSIGFKAEEVDQFIKVIEKRFRLPVKRFDERLTSHIAQESLKEKKKKIDRRSGLIDSNAACIILQDYLECGHNLEIS